MPIVKSYFEQYPEDEYLKMNKEIASKYAKSRYLPIPQMTELELVITRPLSRITSGELSPAEALNLAEQEANKLLEE
jgi:ABC-type glycerol-3-phosphate transport system substrate-binding protein